MVHKPFQDYLLNFEPEVQLMSFKKFKLTLITLSLCVFNVLGQDESSDPQIATPESIEYVCGRVAEIRHESREGDSELESTHRQNQCRDLILENNRSDEALRIMRACSREMRFYPSSIMSCFQALIVARGTVQEVKARLEGCSNLTTLFSESAALPQRVLTCFNEITQCLPDRDFLGVDGTSGLERTCRTQHHNSIEQRMACIRAYYSDSECRGERVRIPSQISPFEENPFSSDFYTEDNFELNEEF